MAEHLNNELMFHVLGYISPSVNSNLEDLLGEWVTEYGFSKDDCLDILQEFENRYGGYDEVIKQFRSKYYNYDAEEFGAEDWRLRRDVLAAMDSLAILMNRLAEMEGIDMNEGHDRIKGIETTVGGEISMTPENIKQIIFALRNQYLGEYGLEEFEAPQIEGNPEWAMRMIKAQYEGVGIDRILSIREDFEGDLFIELLLTNGNRPQLIIEKSMIGMDVTEDYEKWGAEEFGAEFSPADEMALRKYIDLPPAGMGDKKGRRYRKWEHKQKGVLPKQKSLDEMRRKVVDELPTGFKMAQLGILALFGGLAYQSMRKKED